MRPRASQLARMGTAHRCALPLLVVMVWLAGVGSTAVAMLTTPAERALEAYELGYQAYRRGDFSEAESRWRQALTLEPNLIKAHYWLGKLYREMGRLEDAIHHWEETLRLRRLIGERRQALRAVDNETPSQEQIEAARERQRLAYEAWQKGRALVGEGQFKGALSAFTEAVRHYPAHPDYLLALARCQWDLRDRLGSMRTYIDLVECGAANLAMVTEALEHLRDGGRAEVARALLRRLPQSFQVAGTVLPPVASDPVELPPIGMGQVIERRRGQVVIDLGFKQGLTLADEYRLTLRVVRPGKPLAGGPGREVIGRSPDQVVGHLLVTKVLTASAWALIKGEFGTGIREGDRIEFEGQARN